MKQSEMLQMIVGLQQQLLANRPSEGCKPIAAQLTGKYVIVRASAAGCHAGELVSAVDNGNGAATVTLRNARRIYYWVGAASLSGLAVYGSSKSGSKICASIPQHVVLGVCEIIPCSDNGEIWFKSVEEWKQ